MAKLSNEYITTQLELGGFNFVSREPNRKLRVQCQQCLVERIVDQGNILYNIRKNKSPCPTCSGLTRRTNDNIDSSLYNRKIVRLSDYVNDMSKMVWKCSSCNHVWRTRVTKILNDNTGCPKCSYINRNKHSRLSNGDIDFRIVGRPIIRQESYPGSCSQKMKWGCTDCGFSWAASVDKVLNSYTGCPSCANVGGGKFGRKVLRDGELFDSQLEYDCYRALVKIKPQSKIVRQHPYPHNKRMRCDFYIPDENLWIEVSNFKTSYYLDKIEGKRQAIENIGETFMFFRSPGAILRSVELNLIEG